MCYIERVGAYFARNKEIAEYCDMLVAVVASDRTGGTENTIQYKKYKDGNSNRIIIVDSNYELPHNLW